MPWKFEFGNCCSGENQTSTHPFFCEESNGQFVTSDGCLNVPCAIDTWSTKYTQELMAYRSTHILSGARPFRAEMALVSFGEGVLHLTSECLSMMQMIHEIDKPRPTMLVCYLTLCPDTDYSHNSLFIIQMICSVHTHAAHVIERCVGL